MTATYMRAGERPLILLIDSNVMRALRLSAQLVARGYPTEAMTNPSLAHVAATKHHYSTIIFSTDFTRAPDVDELVKLRHMAPGSWIVAVSNARLLPELQATLRCHTDALITPISIEELIARLSAFSVKSRPL